MSWSVTAIGKSDAVATEIEKQFTTMHNCVEPEESVRQSARATIKASLAAQIPHTVIKVAASGSQSTKYGKGGAPDGVQNSLSITIEPQHGFVE